jgi:hypothetical protein
MVHLIVIIDVMLLEGFPAESALLRMVKPF